MVIVKLLTITMSNRYLNDSEYYHDSETKILIQILSENKYYHTSLLEHSNRKTSSPLSRSISSYILYHLLFSCGCGYVEARQGQIHMPVTTCPLS